MTMTKEDFFYIASQLEPSMTKEDCERAWKIFQAFMERE